MYVYVRSLDNLDFFNLCFQFYFTNHLLCPNYIDDIYVLLSSNTQWTE